MSKTTLEMKKKEIANYCREMLDKSGRSEKDVREELGWGMEKMANFLDGSTEFLMHNLYRFADCLGFEVTISIKQEAYTAKDLAMMILDLPEELQNLELHQTAISTCHFSPIHELRVGYLNKYAQETSEGKRVLVMSPKPEKFKLTDEQIDAQWNEGE